MLRRSDIYSDNELEDLMIRVWNVKEATGVLPPSLKLHFKEARLMTSFPVKNGDRYDTYRGLWMAKGDVSPSHRANILSSLMALLGSNKGALLDIEKVTAPRTLLPASQNK
jgi:hypothetical protein